MGSAMVGRLLDAGERVAVWNRTPSRAAPLVSRGAVMVDSMAELGACDIVFTMVSASQDLLDVVCGPSGLLAATPHPRVLIDCSTVSAEASARVREAATRAGVAFLAAPISGNPHVVAAGQACLVVSGPEHSYAEVRDVLALMAGTTVLVGDAEQSRLVKLCLNLFLGITVQALAEVTTLAEKGGTDRAAFLDVLNATMVTTEWVRRRSRDLVALDWTPTFTTELLRKDFDLGLGAARDLEVPMPVAGTVHQLIQSAIGRGLRHEDFLSLYVAQASAAGLIRGADAQSAPRPPSPAPEPDSG